MINILIGCGLGIPGALCIGWFAHAIDRHHSRTFRAAGSEEAAPKVTVNGYTVADALAMHERREELA